MRERQRVRHPAGSGKTSRGTSPRKTIGRTTRSETSEAVRASRDERAESVPTEPSAAPTRSSARTSSGSRSHGSPPVTSPSSMISPKASATPSPSPAETTAASEILAATMRPGVTARARGGRARSRRARLRGRRPPARARGTRASAQAHTPAPGPTAPPSAVLGLLDELDRIGGRPQRRAGLVEREARRLDELEDLVALRAGRQLAQQPLRPAEARAGRTSALRSRRARPRGSASRSGGSSRCRPAAAPVSG